MQTLTATSDVRSASRAWRAAGLTVGFVPTMGALHAGHLSLIGAAREAGAQRIAASIFVNPTQFGADEDLDAYPADSAGDAAKLSAAGVDLLFRPTSHTIYPPGSETAVSLARLPNHLCGLSRPVHFGGVATVVSLLFNIVEPDVAVFGEKDFQQLQVIRRMVRDLHFPIRVVGAPIIREPDGLAMSSRNAYLRGADRERARCLYTALEWAAAQAAGGVRAVAILIDGMRRICEDAGGDVDYIEVVDPESLESLDRIESSARALLAVQVGPARLIDNRSLTASTADP